MSESPPDVLRQQLTRARWRLRMAAPGSPEWDAALTAVQELERRLTVMKVRGRPARIATAEGASIAEDVSTAEGVSTAER